MVLFAPNAWADRPTALDRWLSAHRNVEQQIIWQFSPMDSLKDSVWTAFKLKETESKFLPPTQTNKIPLLCDGSNSCNHQPLTIPKVTLIGPMDRHWEDWPEAFRQKVESYFASYSDYLKQAWPVYQQSTQSLQRPANFNLFFNVDAADAKEPTPPDLQPMNGDTDRVQIMESHAAFDLYAKLIAFQLALEIGGYQPWSVADYGPTSLALMFDGRQTFQFVKKGDIAFGVVAHASGYYVTAYIIPAAPLEVFAFLATNRMLRPTRRDSVAQLLDWERSHLSHRSSNTEVRADCDKTLSEVYYGYNGHDAPVAGMIRGFPISCPLYPEGLEAPSFAISSDIYHWTVGCSGTAPFTAQVLRVMNIPAQVDANDHWRNAFIVEPNDTHLVPSTANFHSAGTLIDDPSYPYEDGAKNARVWTVHADDPYGMVRFPEIPIKEVWVDDATFHQWIREPTDSMSQEARDALYHKNNKAISRRVNDLIIQYLPFYIVGAHCKYDANVTDEANSYVYQTFFKASDPEDSTYTPQDLEAKHFWENLDAKAETLGGCPSVVTQFNAEFYP